MGQRIAKILDIDGEFRETPDSPVAVVREAHDEGKIGEGTIVDPIFNSNVARNLYGRMMTLVEATTDQNKLKAVKDLFAKELGAWENDVYTSARELVPSNDPNGIVVGVYNPTNIYTR